MISNNEKKNCQRTEKEELNEKKKWMIKRNFLIHKFNLKRKRKINILIKLNNYKLK